ncbi:MAG: hypothetical protein MI757_18910 [Pirellulales bacterium]|nr:hypothetical protein [Pirellulales bacterium]
MRILRARRFQYCKRTPRCFAVLALATWFFVGPLGHGAEAASSIVPREHHVWGKFKPGAWTLLRTTTEELDTAGKVSSTSTTETRTTLLGVDDKGVQLRIERVIEVAGKRFVKKPVEVRLTFSGAAQDQAEVVKLLGSEEFQLDGRRVACDVRHAEIKKADMTRNVKVLYSSKHSPYVLRREIDEKGGAGKAYQSITDVTALDMPYRVLNDIKSTAQCKTVLRNGKSVVTTLSVMTMDVPGGVVMESSKEANLEGKLIRQTTVELADYGLSPPGGASTVGVGSSEYIETRRRMTRGRLRRTTRRSARSAAINGAPVAPQPADAASPDGPTISPVSRSGS